MDKSAGATLDFGCSNIDELACHSPVVSQKSNFENSDTINTQRPTNIGKTGGIITTQKVFLLLETHNSSNIVLPNHLIDTQIVGCREDIVVDQSGYFALGADI